MKVSSYRFAAAKWQPELPDAPHAGTESGDRVSNPSDTRCHHLLLCFGGFREVQNSLALAISCYARRTALGQRADDELEALAGSLPADCTIAGFYAYGEIGRDPRHKSDRLGADLHNQTMAITFLVEHA